MLTFIKVTGQSRPLQSTSNLQSQTSQPRNATTGRIPSGKPTIWNAPQPRDASSTVTDSSWAQAAVPRAGTQLDFSNQSFPSLNNAGQQSQSFNPGSSAWQTGPPPSESVRRQPLHTTRLQTRSQQPNTDAFYSTDTFSRNVQPELSLSEPQQQRRSSAAPNGPPGLMQRSTHLNDGVSGDPSRVTSPAGQGPGSRSPLSQNLNGTIGQERPPGDGVDGTDNRRDFYQQSAQSSQLQRDAFAGRDAFEETSDQNAESVFVGMSEKDKYGMKGFLALAEGPNPTFRSLMHGQDLAALSLNMNSDQPLLPSYTGAFGTTQTHPLRPLDADYSIPDVYTIHKVAPLHTRINSFSDETLFYIFYSMPRDYIQVIVAQELMERKWRYHTREQMWLMRDDASQYPRSEDQRSEQGYYIWWDKNLWKKVRRPYHLNYEDLDDVPAVGNRRAQPGSNGLGAAGVNGSTGPFNAVPGLERVAASGRGF